MSAGDDAETAQDSAGTVLAVCIGPGGIPKAPVASARVGPLGLEGDGHRHRYHGGPRRAVCILSTADYASLEADGVSTAGPGTFGENLLLDGISFAELRAGDRLSVGAGVELVIDDVRAPCGTLRSVDARFPDLMVGRSGFLCRVLEPGEIAVGDPVRLARPRA